MLNRSIISTIFKATLFTFLICFSSLFAGLMTGTKIATPTEMISIENLKIGDLIYGYDAESHNFPTVIIENIKIILVQSIYLITTEHETIAASSDQLFYEVKSQKFIFAEQLKAGDLFFTKDAQIIKCTNINIKNIPSTVHSLTLTEPHLFFSSEKQILTHNAFPVLVLGIPVAAPVLKLVLSASAIATAFYAEKLVTSLPIFKNHRTKRKQKTYLEFLNRADINESKTILPSSNENTASQGGFDPDPDDPRKKNNNNSKKERIKILETKVRHIFRKEENHFELDTPQNREIIENVANDEKNYLGPNRFGNKWYGKIIKNGKQIWVEVRDNKIINAGINKTPQEYNPISGLSQQFKPVKIRKLMQCNK